MSIKGPSLEQVLASQAQKPNSPDHDLGVVYVFIRNFISIFSVIPAVLLLRSRFGERYLRAFHVAASWFVVAFVAVGAWMSDWNPPWQAEQPEGTSASTIGVLFLLAYSAQMARHYFGVQRRRLADDYSVHSRSNGDPWRIWLKLRLPPAVVGLVIEPVLIVVLGYILGHVLEAPALQALTWLVAIPYFLEQQIIADAERAKLLDHADAILEQRLAEERAALISGRGGAKRVHPGASPQSATAVAMPVATNLRKHLKSAGSEATTSQKGE